MAARQTRGRQRIPIRLIQNQDDLYASFSKRRLGLFKKASELSTLCGADVGVIVFSPTDNPFSFFSPTMDSVVDRYINPDSPLRHSARAIDSHARARIDALNKRLDELLEQKLELREYQRQLEEADEARERGWWEEAAVDGLDKERVREWTAWFGNFKARVEDKMAHLRNGGSTSSASVAPAAPSYYGADQFAPPLNLFNSPPLDPFYRHVTRVGGGTRSSHLFSSQYRCYISPEGEDPFAARGSGGGGESGQCVYPVAAYVDQSGGLMPPSHTPITNLCFPPNYRTIASGVENASAAAGEEEAAASNQGGN